MKICRSCTETIPDNARFCPFCGTSVIEETITCPTCGEENDLHASNCGQCGHVFFVGKNEAPKQAPKEKPKQAPAEDIFENSAKQETNAHQELADQFSLAFERRLKEEHAPNTHGAYIDRFYRSDFRSSVDYRLQQLVEETQRIAEVSPQPRKDKKILLDHAFEELLDYFIVRYCKDINEAHFSEAILKYQGLPFDKIDLSRLINDYIYFEEEDETVYFNFVTMPPQKLRNAAQSFLSYKKGEVLYFICNLSVLGSCKEGFAMTNTAIYWKMLMEPPQRVFYNKLRDIRREEDWITINGIFFNANKSLNLKLLRLLKKLREVAK